jgi:hypothetical protein
MDGVLAVVPTGSGGYITVEGGEYKKWKSDLDFTLVMKNEVDVKPHERKAIELLIDAGFRLASGGLAPEAIDASFMVDGVDVVRARSVELTDPAKIIDQCKAATSADGLKKPLEQIQESYKNLLQNMPHGERYLTPDRIMALVWLNSLGQDVLVRQPGTRGFVRMKKGAALEAGFVGDEVKGIIRNPQARLARWMALGIVVDDLGFLGKKLPKYLDDLDVRPGNREVMDGLVKELDKRAIRVLLGFITTHPDGLAEINALGPKAVQGEVCDHKTICEIGQRVVDKLAADGQMADAAHVKQILQNWADVKLGTAKGSDFVARRCERLGQEAPDPVRDPAAFTALFKAEVQETFDVLNNLGRSAIGAGAQELSTLYTNRKQWREEAQRPGLDEGARALAKQRADTADEHIKYRMTALAYWYDKLGHHLEAKDHDENGFKQTFRDALQKAGATREDFRTTLKAAGMKDEQIDAVINKITWPPPDQPAPKGTFWRVPAWPWYREGLTTPAAWAPPASSPLPLRRAA